MSHPASSDRDTGSKKTWHHATNTYSYNISTRKRTAWHAGAEFAGPRVHHRAYVCCMQWICSVRSKSQQKVCCYGLGLLCQLGAESLRCRIRKTLRSRSPRRTRACGQRQITKAYMRDPVSDAARLSWMVSMRFCTAAEKACTALCTIGLRVCKMSWTTGPSHSRKDWVACAAA